MNYKSFNLGDWIGHISGAIEDESELDGNEMRDLVEFLTTLNKEPILDKIRAEIAEYGSICVAYAITDKTKTDEGIKKLISDVLKQAKEQVLDIIDKYNAEMENEE